MGVTATRRLTTAWKSSAELGRAQLAAGLHRRAGRARPARGERTDYRRGIVARTVQAVSGTVVPTTIQAFGGRRGRTAERVCDGRAAAAALSARRALPGPRGHPADGLDAGERRGGRPGRHRRRPGQHRAARGPGSGPGCARSWRGSWIPRSQVGPDFSFRRDVYRDFGRCFSFHRSGPVAGDGGRSRQRSATRARCCGWTSRRWACWPPSR